MIQHHKNTITTAKKFLLKRYDNAVRSFPDKVSSLFASTILINQDAMVGFQFQTFRNNFIPIEKRSYFEDGKFDMYLCFDLTIEFFIKSY